MFCPVAPTPHACSSLLACCLVTLDKADIDPAVGQLPASLMHEVDRGLRRVLGL